MANAQLPQVYVDLFGTVATSAISGQAVVLYNRFPEPDEADVPVGAPIEIWWADTAEVGINSAIITVSSSAGSVVAVSIAAGVPTFNGAYAGSTYTRQTSLGGATLNEHKLQLIRSAPWTSQERVLVRVQVTPASGAALDSTYSFYVEDTTVPRLAEARTQGLSTILAKFSEPLLMTADPYGALRAREITGRVTFTAPDIVEIENAGITAQDVGSYVSFAGSERAVNNSYFRIASVAAGVPTVITTVEQSIATEAPQLAQRAFVGPYKLAPVMETARRIPTFTPSVVSAERLDDQTVILTLDQELSPGRPYQLFASNVADAATPANVIDDTSVSMVTEQIPNKAGRKFSLWEMIPQDNRREDTSGDLERTVRCFDEITQLLLADIDRYEEIFDIDVMPPDFVDGALFHLGNPYTFLRNDMEKRRVLASLVRTYKDGGVERSIEEAVLDILGITVNVFPFNNADVSWVMGESEMGLTSILGTDDEFLRYSYEIIVFEQQDVVVTGSTKTTIKLQTGGLGDDLFVGRTLRVGEEDRVILSNTVDTVTVDQPYSSVPPPNAIATILGALSEEERGIITEIANIWQPIHTHFVRFIESGSSIPTY
jgi:phage tail-like protein